MPASGRSEDPSEITHLFDSIRPLYSISIGARTATLSSGYVTSLRGAARQRITWESSAKDLAESDGSATLTIQAANGVFDPGRAIVLGNIYCTVRVKLVVGCREPPVAITVTVEVLVEG